VNGPLGLEQGFTFARPPGKSRSGPLTLELALSGDLTASADATGTGAILSRSGGAPALRYRGLTAIDATGRELRAWLKVGEKQLWLQVDDTRAQYPLVVDPLLEQAKLTASDGATTDLFGVSVAVSGDTIVIGAVVDDVGTNLDQGSAYVFVKPAAGWSQTLTENAQLTASDGAANDLFGGSVAVSGDAVVAGAATDTIGVNDDQGSAYVFVGNQADLLVSKTGSPATVATGTNLTYSITVTNNGPNNADTVTLTDNLTGNTTFVSNSGASGWNCTNPAVGSAGAINCTIATLASGATAVFTVRAKVSCAVPNAMVITNTATVTAATPDPDLSNNTSTVSVTASNPRPVVNATVATGTLSPGSNHAMASVGLSAVTSDGVCPAPTVSRVEVFGSEDDETPTDINEVFSPDSHDIGLGTLRLRAERVSSLDGRVYLILVKATDAGGAVGFGTATVVVPKNPSPSSTNSVNDRAAAAKAFADANNGNPPPGYFVIGDGPIIGKKQ
jgi:uncharacterized repeat protein (TIGR01451 family)